MTTITTRLARAEAAAVKRAEAKIEAATADAIARITHILTPSERSALVAFISRNTSPTEAERAIIAKVRADTPTVAALRSAGAAAVRVQPQYPMPVWLVELVGRQP